MNLTDKISEHCTYGEGIHSDTAQRLGIPNIPNVDQLEAMKYVATEVFDKVRDYLNEPLFASSFFRSAELNNATRGASSTSQHMKGEAIDHYKPGRHKEIFKWVKENIDFDQLIWEYGDTNEPAWVHVSKINPLVANRQNRKEILRYFIDQSGNMRGIPFDLEI